MPKCVTGCVRKSGRLPRLTFSIGPTLCQKTRSGKIMRRILRKIAAGDTSNLGDTSTLADPAVVEKLLEEKQSMKVPS
ncbi:Acetyl-coenzyme A synthetase [Serratia fonticola]|uniref:Acetyl-coenzyme A synthetase n=1 Tax=Serratia fonticola TaxID=47917 RepID=A0A4U9T5D2_SERFO|nr:Acetyl-coenzyme A synthetase [Serratia fonticola]